MKFLPVKRPETSKWKMDNSGIENKHTKPKESDLKSMQQCRGKKALATDSEFTWYWAALLIPIPYLSICFQSAPASLRLLNITKQGLSWEPSVGIHEPVGDILIQTATWGQGHPGLQNHAPSQPHIPQNKNKRH